MDSWAPVIFLINYKLAWKTATLLALVTAKHCSDLTLFCIDQHLFLWCHASIFNPASGGKMDQLGHLPPQIFIDSHSSVNLCPLFYLRAYLWCTEPFRKKPDRLHVTPLSLGNDMQHRPVCAKTISSWIRNIFCTAKEQMSLGGCSICSLGTWCFLVSSLQAGDWARVSTQDKTPFSTYFSTTDQHQFSVQCAVLCLSD